MKRTRRNAGFTLIELMFTVLILVILFAGIGISMEAGTKIYREGIFESDSSLLAETLNNSLGDILRNSTDIKINEDYFEDSAGNNIPATQVGFVFSNSSYAAQDAYIQPASSGRAVLVIKSLKNTEAYELVNIGAYPDLAISELTITYHPANLSGTDGSRYGGYFSITYVIQSTQYISLSREVHTVVRLLNDP